MKQIVLAFHHYASAYDDVLPPAALYSKDGKPLLSWRVRILPWLGEEKLYSQFKLDEPWDSEHNLNLLARMPKIYALPGVETKEAYTTFYRVFVGPETLYPERQGADRGKCAYTVGAIPDGTNHTIFVAEAGEAVPWTKPEELIYDAKKPLPKLGKMFPDRFLAGMGDGSVRWISPSKPGTSPEGSAPKKQVSETTLRRAITPADGNVLDIDW